MNPERWQQIDQLFAAALELCEAGRPAFLDAACGSDGELRNQVGQLLEADGEAQGFLEPSRDRGELGEMFSDLALPEQRSRIGPYQVVRILGHGGMGTVYLASRAGEPAHRQVAVKLCRHSLASSEVRRRFRTEHQILARLEHPNVAHLRDAGTTEDGRPYLVMEYVAGSPIDQHCDRHRLPLGERLELFRQLCSAVHHAHQHQLVHRDLKPANVLVTDQGRVKLLDFGIAKLLDPHRFVPSPEPTRIGIRLLTPGYASPEQLRGEAVTPASDVYCLGVLLFELLSGSSPYQLHSRSLLAIDRAVCEREADRMSVALGRLRGQPRTDCARQSPSQISRARGFHHPRQLRQRLQGNLENIVAIALRKQPASRYRSAEELSEELRRHLLRRPIHARPRRFGRHLGELLRWRIAAAVGRRRKKSKLGDPFRPQNPHYQIEEKSSQRT